MILQWHINKNCKMISAGKMRWYSYVGNAYEMKRMKKVIKRKRCIILSWNFE